jgi:hypothetical protein
LIGTQVPDKGFSSFIVRLLYSDFSAFVHISVPVEGKGILTLFLERLTVVETIEGLIGRRPPAQVRLVMSESWCSAFLGCVNQEFFSLFFKESV